MLPLQYDMAGNQYLLDGAWMHMMKEVPGEGVNQKLDYLATCRWLPIWMEILKEVKHLKVTGGTLGNTQRKVLYVNKLPLSVLELAMTNRPSMPAGVCWEGNTPNARDLMIWQLFWAVTKVKDNAWGRLLRQSFEATVLDSPQWANAEPNFTQSQGLHEIPFPLNEGVTMANMAAHLKICRVTHDFMDHSLRPYVQQNQTAAAEWRNAPAGAIIRNPNAHNTQMMTTSSTETAQPMPSVYVEIPMDGIDSNTQ
jgi:hypothetical protein